MDESSSASAKVEKSVCKIFNLLFVIIRWEIFVTVFYVACQLLCGSFDLLLPKS